MGLVVAAGKGLVQGIVLSPSLYPITLLVAIPKTRPILISLFAHIHYNIPYVPGVRCRP
jgi:hypothetical protein